MKTESKPLSLAEIKAQIQGGVYHMGWDWYTDQIAELYKDSHIEALRRGIDIRNDAYKMKCKEVEHLEFQIEALRKEIEELKAEVLKAYQDASAADNIIDSLKKQAFNE